MSWIFANILLIIKIAFRRPRALETEVFAMDTYFIHSVLSNYSNHNDSSINFEQENQKVLDSQPRAYYIKT